MNKLTATTLGSICDDVKGIIRTGPFGSQLHQSDYKNEDLPVVMPKDIVNRKISTESIARIGDNDVKRLAQHRLKIGDIVYGRRGDIGRCALISERENGWFCGTGCLRISLGESVVNSKFLYYYLGQSDIIGWICNQAIGATLPNLNTSIIRSIPISYPALKSQKRIADILSAYDDLIENNTRRIKILEEMAQLLYREWFVNFRFPGHEDVKLVESAIGLIPEGWEVCKLGDMIDFKSGKMIKSQEKGEYPVYGSNGVIGKSSESIYRNGIIIGRVGAYCGSLMYCRSHFWASDNTIVAKVKVSDFGIELIYFILKSLDLRNYAGGSAQPLLTQTTVKELLIAVPNASVSKKFEQIVRDLWNSRENLSSRIENLRETRDRLLPKLISGEIDVEALDCSSLEMGESIAA